MENTKYGRRRERRWTPIWAKAQDTRANSSWENSPSEEQMEHWTPTGVEPKDYDDEVTLVQKHYLIRFCMVWLGRVTP